MTTIRLTNTATRKKEAFAPLDPANVRMYVCGPTVYDRAHLGNARPVVVFDVLFRLLRHVYGEGAVTYVRNFTDVDDKINARAAETGRPIRDITDETIGWYHADMDALGALRPTHEPRATDYIGQMVAMIQGLIASGHAYAAEGHVLFRVRRYPDYGKLSGRSLDDMIAGARVEVAPFKEDPMDFVLWKPSSGIEPGWPGPVVDGVEVSRGRPGWHIECSAMARELLGERFDIHGGGLDLQFPHHENEVAQSVCAHGGHGPGDMAQVWLHNEMLLVEGKKMSKSLGNFIVLRDVGVSVLDEEGNEISDRPDILPDGFSLRVASRIAVRLFLLETHYRKPMNWTREGFNATQARLKRFRESAWVARRQAGSIDPRVVEAVADDLNTSLALHWLDELVKEDRYSDLSASMDFLGLYQFEFDGPVPVSSRDFEATRTQFIKDYQSVLQGHRAALQPYSVRLADLRARALQQKDFADVDRLKSALVSAGVEVRMSNTAVELIPGPDFDPAKLEALK